MPTSTQRRLHGGSITETGFAATGAGHFFYVYERPDEIGDFATIVCSPLLSERLKNNRREVLAARRLAGRGIPTLRFHYLGSGNSDDEPGGLSITSMVRDTQAAIGLLEELSGVPVRAGLATRLAALTLAHAAPELPTLAFWDPTPTGAAFVRDPLRAKLIMSTKRGDTVTTADLQTALEVSGAVDVGGFALTTSLHDSAKAANFPEPSPALRRLHITALNPRGLGRAALRAIDDWAASLVEPPDLHQTTFDEGWWFHQDTNLLSPIIGEELNRDVAHRTADWLVRSGSAA